MKIFVLIVPAGVLLFVLAWAGARMAPETAPVARGADYAQVRGCVGCHGDPDNPVADANDKNCSDTNRFSWHPEYNVECTDVMAYFETIRLRRSFDERAKLSYDNPLIVGERLARTYHCFQCHGHLGQGGFGNANSLKGYVPGYFGSDFMALTNNASPDAVREWIMHGKNSTLLEAPVLGKVAAFFFDRQAVSMPSYKSLQPEEIEVLVEYVIALNEYGPMTADIVRSYGDRSRSKDLLITVDNDPRPRL